MKENNCKHLLTGPALSLGSFSHTASMYQPGRHRFLLPCKVEKGTLFLPGVLHWFIYGLTFLVQEILAFSQL